MPFRIPEAIKTFDFKLSEDGLPLAKVILLGGVRYVEVCPCCSCIHQLPMKHQGSEFEPRCLVREWNTANYKAWLKRYPEATKHRTVQLVDAETWATLAVQSVHSRSRRRPPLAVVEKPKRARKAKKAA